KIHKVYIDPTKGLTDADADDVSRKIGVPEGSIAQARVLLQGLYKAFDETDCSLAEIKPLIYTGDGKVVALDAKMNFDSNALYRHEDIVAMRDLEEEDPAEIEASKFGLSYISLDGNIGCLVNGAGLAMATMDTIKLYGANPANFLDVGGTANAQTVEAGFRIILKDPKVKAILINIFGGIVRCDRVAQGVIDAYQSIGNINIPIIVRLQGTNADVAKKLIDDSGLKVQSAILLSEAAELVNKAVA
ncbi:MAG TPA: succinate--CoA ligase subunit beta, partial [Chitinophagaceae bacterium]|nr:succinate--CoA ligase subunit beta [Chitinophagaceae bacterium]